MKFLFIFLLLSGICFGEEFIADKPISHNDLVKEIENTLSLSLTGEHQQGSVNISGNKIEIKIKDRDLTFEEKEKITEIISKHNVNELQSSKEKNKIDKKNMIKQKFGWTDEDLKTLKEILRND